VVTVVDGTLAKMHDAVLWEGKGSGGGPTSDDGSTVRMGDVEIEVLGTEPLQPD